MSHPAPSDIASPDINPETAPIWEAAARGELLVGHCGDCGKYHHYPRSLCPLCHSEAVTFVPASGQGTIYSFSTFRRAADPYTLAWVVLEEGPGMMTNIVDADPDMLAIDQPVDLVFVPSADGTPVPMFRPR